MDFSQFIHFIHNGAFSTFEDIVRHLTNSDLKALRIVVGNPLANAILPYMFNRAFFSLHDEDLDVLKLISDHPAISRNIRELCWESTHCQTYGAINVVGCSYDDDVCPSRQSVHLLRDQGIISSRIKDQLQCEEPETDQEFLEQKYLYWLANDFWMRKEHEWMENANSDKDIRLLTESLTRLPTLQRISLFCEQTSPSVPRDHYLKMFNTPRARSWATLPFYSYLPTPRPNMRDEGIQGFTRALNKLSQLCYQEILQIGSLIIESYGRGQLPTTCSNRMDTNVQPYTDFESICWNGYGSQVPDLTPTQPHKLTLRLVIELRRFTSSLWQEYDPMQLSIDSLCSKFKDSLEELTYCRANLTKLVEEYRSRGKYEVKFFPLTHCINLRKLRLHDCRCPNAGWFLTWVAQNTNVKEIELDCVASISTSWFAVLHDLKRGGILFEELEIRNCRSPSEILGTWFDLDLLAPWNGESEKVVRWLRGEGGDEVFPLWQGPG